MRTDQTEVIHPRWYFGGLASTTATCFTHPFDLIKVLLQTASKEKLSLMSIAVRLYKQEGLPGFYNGLTASLLRQVTYATVRFGVYDTAKNMIDHDISLIAKIGIAFVGGAMGGFIGTPPDKINVRMQNDMKLPKEKRFNYKNAVDGLWKVYKIEGASKLFSGGGTSAVRAGIMAVGQLSFYDQIKKTLLTFSFFEDKLFTHLTSSLSAAICATTMTQPLDVIKTRIMNAKPNEFKNFWEVVRFTAAEGPLSFFRGFLPAFLRIGPQTILIFVFYERLRINFGYLSSH